MCVSQLNFHEKRSNLDSFLSEKCKYFKSSIHLPRSLTCLELYRAQVNSYQPELVSLSGQLNSRDRDIVRDSANTTGRFSSLTLLLMTD